MYYTDSVYDLICDDVDYFKGFAAAGDFDGFCEAVDVVIDDSDAGMRADEQTQKDEVDYQLLYARCGGVYDPWPAVKAALERLYMSERAVLDDPKMQVAVDEYGNKAANASWRAFYAPFNQLSYAISVAQELCSDGTKRS